MSLEALLNWPAPDRPLPPGQTVDASSLGRTFIITDTLDRSASFLLHQFVLRHLRLPNWVVRLVCISQLPAHYAAVQKKLGIHLTQHKNTFESIDVFSNLDTLSSINTIDSSSVASGLTCENDPTVVLFRQISSTVRDQRHPCIVIDDVTMLLYAGWSVQQLVKLIMALSGFVVERSGCLVILTHDDCPDDLELVSFNSWIVRLANILILVRPLKSGYTDDVHGQLTVRLGPQSLWEPVNAAGQLHTIQEGEVLFRINDSSVDWLSKGTTVM
ncbi:hypothetical protein BASA50_001183 [Batrachochytrium salamandrivorans]|uniref:Elongator complex protein 6 n=1 Tax=Batrachochytrium salamandrivorans TaxID=1357716 RepID=A0ABQ8EUS3_9FUNG|nr:hypothetical protein BASA60_011184 [Batrachochytrium salamandrivorans]KAH6568550.1 hypothetical protein BASA62_005347 [Batrachochytrium salamandrivorans]KAH6579171.1 hypothetical protein BASA61_010473 [Batrachochytrium salamandrivorans]KAH6585574.1 hypothetical protein BASA50_001183 [Batrachochytrium salamandrivorans]KAH9271353.1 hypothetical protein BASA83_006444 [Batrachochytrium salamandrivorans]